MHGLFACLLTLLFLMVPTEPAFGLTQAGREARDLICRKNIRLTNVLVYPHLPMASFVYYEDGATKLLRSGYEVTLFRRLKQRFRRHAPPLTQKQLFYETIDAMIEQRRERQPVGPWSLNIPTILLTAHNVTRLLARPELWSAEDFDPARRLHITPNGQNRYEADSAFPIILDLRGITSVDNGPTMRELAGKNPGSFQASWIHETFFGPGGVFVFYQDALMQPRAIQEREVRTWSAAHWNGGIHYYYFAGALAHPYGSVYGAIAASTLEGWIKWSMGDEVRYEVQSQYGFYAGVHDYRQLVAGLGELSDDDRRCRSVPPPPPILPPPLEEKESGIECGRFISSTTGRETCVCRHLATGRILTTPDARRRCRELTGDSPP